MAIINQRTGYYGFTTDGAGDTAGNIDGNVKKVIFVIQYPNRVNDIEFTLSDGAEDWAAQMGDGAIIPIDTPKILYQNKDNTIIEFNLSAKYPSNSPCVLVYRSDSAWFNVKEISETRPWTPNAVSGHFGYTTEGYDGTKSGNGYVNRVICAVPYPTQKTDVEFTLSSDPSHWGIRVPSGDIISLRDPVVLFSNRDCASIQFSMDTPYPSNSPCVMIYRSADAWFNIKAISGDDKFIPTTNIKNVPTNIAAGVAFDLSVPAIEPINASKQEIIWTIISGSAIIDNNLLIATANGDIVLKATIEKGVNETTDYTKTFNITASKNTINILIQPDPEVLLIAGEINTSILVNATSTSGLIQYQWYRNTTSSTTDATIVSGATSPSYRIPTSLTRGDYFYFCEVSSVGANTVNSTISKVHIALRLKGIEITPRTATLELRGERQLSLNVTPVGADMVSPIWSSSNADCVQITNSGKISAITSGSVVITARTQDGLFTNTMDLTVPIHIPVGLISGMLTKVETNTPTALLGTVTPANASRQTIDWSVLNAGSTRAVITNGKINAPVAGTCVVRATIVDGNTIGDNYIQDVTLNIIDKFIPVGDINLTLPAEIRAGDNVTLTGTVVPVNTTYNKITFTISSAGSTGATINNGILTSTSAGNIVINATVTNGLTGTQDYVKPFNIEILPKWISVEGLTNFPALMEEVALGVTLNATVAPTNATAKDITYVLKSGSAAGAIMTGNEITIPDYESVVWWIKNDNPTPPDYLDLWIPAITDSIIVEVTVKNGIKKGEDFIRNMSIGIIPPPAPDSFIPLTHISYIFPSINRARRPILMERIEKTPWNATHGNINGSFLRPITGQQGFVMQFEASKESIDFWEKTYNMILDPMYDWTHKGFYAYIFEDILVDVNYAVENGSEGGSTYRQTDSVLFLPEYIPVWDIINIPASIPAKTPIQLAPEVITNKPIDIENTATYDLEIPSYSQVKWTIETDGGTGANITPDGLLTFTNVGRATIKGEVEQGTQEEFTWYDKNFNAISYKKSFQINVTKEELPYDYPIMSLTLQDNSIVNANRMVDITNCSNDRPANSSITIGQKTFQKDQVTKIKFWEDQYDVIEPPDDTIAVTEITGISNIAKEFQINPTTKIFYCVLDDENINILPANATKKDIEWNITNIPVEDTRVRIDTNDSIGGGGIPGVPPKAKVLRIESDFPDVIHLSAIVRYGINKTTAFFKLIPIFNENNVHTSDSYIDGIYVSHPDGDNAYAGVKNSKKRLRANFIAKDSVPTIVDYNNITWRLGEGSYEPGTTIQVDSDSVGNRTAILTIDPKEPVGKYIRVEAHYLKSDNTTIIEKSFIFIMKSDSTILLPPPPVNNLKNFARNFTNLIQLDRIPDTVNGDECLRNFLYGCTSFNQALTIPKDITGSRCLEGYMTGCTSFNQNVVIPSKVTGHRCLSRFMSGCRLFNRPITIPSGVTGVLCLARFLEKCISFNQAITIPEGVTGERCLEYFLAGCETFNNPIKIPDKISGSANMRGFFQNTMDMVSNISISQEAATNCEANGLTLSCYVRDVAFDVGVPIIGTGSVTFRAKYPNMTTSTPMRNLKQG